MPTKVDQFVSRDGMHPDRQRQRRIVSVTLIVNGEQRFLHEILDFIGEILQAYAIEQTQAPAQFDEQNAISHIVAGRSLDLQDRVGKLCASHRRIDDD